MMRASIKCLTETKLGTSICLMALAKSSGENCTEYTPFITLCKIGCLCIDAISLYCRFLFLREYLISHLHEPIRMSDSLFSSTQDENNESDTWLTKMPISRFHCYAPNRDDKNSRTPLNIQKICMRILIPRV